MNFGLVFDYSAHISHMFMTTGGTNRQRAAVRNQRFRCVHILGLLVEARANFRALPGRRLAAASVECAHAHSLFRGAGVGL